MNDREFALLLALVAVTSILGLALFSLPSQSELCTLAFSHAESRLDSLEVTVTYDYCELPEDG